MAAACSTNSGAMYPASQWIGASRCHRKAQALSAQPSANASNAARAAARLGTPPSRHTQPSQASAASAMPACSGQNARLSDSKSRQ